MEQRKFSIELDADLDDVLTEMKYGEKISKKQFINEAVRAALGSQVPIGPGEPKDGAERRLVARVLKMHRAYCKQGKEEFFTDFLETLEKHL